MAGNRNHLAHNIRGRLNGIIGFAELLHDGKAGGVSAEQREFLGDVLASAHELGALLDELLALPAADPAGDDARAPGSGHHPAATTPAPAASITASPASQPTILIVEDDPADRRWLENRLAEAGYAAESVATGAEAIARCRERRFDGITLDLMLPDMNGWEIFRKIREDRTNADTPVVVVSTVPQKVAAEGRVVRDLVAKPAAPAELLAALAHAGVPSSRARPILVVDNNHQALKLAAAVLKRQGYRVVCCDNGPSALDAAAIEPPAAALVDLLMPGMSGFEFIERLRTTEAGHDTPVIVWTVMDLTAEDHRRLGAAVERIVPKRETGARGIVDAVAACSQRSVA